MVDEGTCAVLWAVDTHIVGAEPSMKGPWLSTVLGVVWGLGCSHLSMATWGWTVSGWGVAPLVHLRVWVVYATKVLVGPWGAKGSCFVSIHQMAVVIRRAMSTRATLGPCWRPSRCLVRW